MGKIHPSRRPLRSRFTMFMVNWAYKALGYLGLWSKNAKILFLGLDNAGKTTMLHMLKDAKLSSHQPTNHPNMEELKIGDLRIQAHDLGGHRSARRLWNDYLTGVDAIIYMIDTTGKNAGDTRGIRPIEIFPCSVVKK